MLPARLRSDTRARPEQDTFHNITSAWASTPFRGTTNSLEFLSSAQRFSSNWLKTAKGQFILTRDTQHGRKVSEFPLFDSYLHAARSTQHAVRSTQFAARIKIASCTNFNFPIENNRLDHAFAWFVSGSMN